MATSLSSERPANKCAKCGTEGYGYQRCKRCKAAYYCSKHCQREDWPKHRSSCSSAEHHTRTYPRYDLRDRRDFNLAISDEFGPYVIQYRRFWPFESCPTQTESDNGAEGVHVELQNAAEYVKSFVSDTCSVLTEINLVPHEWFPIKSPGESVLIVKIVKEDPYWIRHGVWIQDYYSQRAVVYFYLDDDCPLPYFQWQDLKPGNHLCIFDPTLHLFLDGKIGFRINMADQARVLCGCKDCCITDKRDVPAPEL